MIKKYRKKPVEIEAIQFTGDNFMEIKEWMGKSGSDRDLIPILDDETKEVRGVTISTLEGDMIANVGDFIIKGVHNEFYPCKPDIFKKTYDESTHTGEEIVGVSDPEGATYSGYFTCPVCNSENEIEGWKLKEDGKIIIEFSAQTYTSMAVVCGGCGAKWEMGIYKKSGHPMPTDKQADE